MENQAAKELVKTERPETLREMIIGQIVSIEGFKSNYLSHTAGIEHNAMDLNRVISGGGKEMLKAPSEPKGTLGEQEKNLESYPLVELMTILSKEKNVLFDIIMKRTESVGDKIDQACRSLA